MKKKKETIKTESRLVELVKKIMSMTPAGTISNEIIPNIVETFKSGKDELFSGLRHEFRDALARVDLMKVVDDVVQKYDFEIQTTVRLKERKINRKLVKDR